MRKLLILAAAVFHFAGSAFADALPSNVILQPAQPSRVSEYGRVQIPLANGSSSVSNTNQTSYNNSTVKSNGQLNQNYVANPITPTASVKTTVQNSVSSSQKTSINQCTETVSVNSEQLFYLTLTALNKMNYKIKEVQSKTGTVLFQAAQKEFMVTIADIDKNKTFIKILPTDSDYGFSPALIQNVFYFVKANSSVTPTVM